MDALLKNRAKSLIKTIENLVWLVEKRILPLSDLDVQISLLNNSYKSWETLWARYEADAEDHTEILLDCLRLKGTVASLRLSSLKNRQKKVFSVEDWFLVSRYIFNISSLSVSMNPPKKF